MSSRSVRLLVALLAAGGLVAGCSNESGVTTETVDPPSTASATSPPSSSGSTSTAEPSTESRTRTSTTASPSSPASATGGLSAAEAADRAAVEAQWIESWDVYLEIARVPAAEREQLVATVAVDPAKANMLTDAAQFDTQGLQTYGQLGHRISWPQPIDGAHTALIDDCQDRSAAGSLETATGHKVTVGVARDHYQGSLVRGDDGKWRVARVFYLQDEPC